MTFEQELERLQLAIMNANLRRAEHEEARAAAERRLAEMIEMRGIETLAKDAKRGRP